MIASAANPEALRGPQFDCAWSDEPAKWRYCREAWDMLQFCLRLGDDPRILDIGCGNGAQTLCLAATLGGRITAVDNHQPYLDELERRLGMALQTRNLALTFHPATLESDDALQQLEQLLDAIEKVPG